MTLPRTALSMAKLDKEMSPSELAAIAEHYLVERGPSLSMVDYASFLREMDIIFGTQVRRRGEERLRSATNSMFVCREAHHARMHAHRVSAAR